MNSNFRILPVDILSLNKNIFNWLNKFVGIYIIIIMQFWMPIKLFIIVNKFRRHEATESIRIFEPFFKWHVDFLLSWTHGELYGNMTIRNIK